MVIGYNRFKHTTADVSKAWAEQIHTENRMLATHQRATAFPDAAYFAPSPTSGEPSALLPTPPQRWRPAEACSLSSRPGSASHRRPPAAADTPPRPPPPALPPPPPPRALSREAALHAEMGARQLRRKLSKVDTRLHEMQDDLLGNKHENLVILDAIKGLKDDVRQLVQCQNARTKHAALVAPPRKRRELGYYPPARCGDGSGSGGRRSGGGSGSSFGESLSSSDAVTTAYVTTCASSGRASSRSGSRRSRAVRRPSPLPLM